MNRPPLEHFSLLQGFAEDASIGDIGRALVRDPEKIAGRAPRPEDVGWEEQLEKEVHCEFIMFLS